MARTGMTNLIGELRTLAVAGTNDYSLGTTNYWTDDQLQTVLDRHQLTVVREELYPVEQYEGGTLVYKEHRSQYGSYRPPAARRYSRSRTCRATSARALVNGSYKGRAGIRCRTGGSACYQRIIGIYRAAACVWRQKAGTTRAGFQE